MCLFFGSKNLQQIPNNIKLVSVHIPKTAGTSFRNILKSVYGDQRVIRLDIDLTYGKLKINEKLFNNKSFNKKWQVIHGHFSPNTLNNSILISPETPYITWLRDPVERVMSNYYYLEKRLKEELNEEAKDLDILAKMQRTLIEYARAEKNRNRMSKFLDGKPLEDFLFVGLTEHFSEDLVDLSSLLGWANFKEFKYNVTDKRVNNVSEDVKEEIKQLNIKDVELYQKAINLRIERRKKLL
jgi:hypothetical protein